MLNVDVENIKWLFENYGEDILSGDYLLGVDNHEELGGADLVLYDVYGMNIKTQKELSEWCTKYGGDEENLEIERTTLVRNAQTIKLADAIGLLVENAIDRIDASELTFMLTEGTRGYYDWDNLELETELESVFGRPFKIID